MGKLVVFEDLLEERRVWRREGLRVVWTNGCFDLLHAGHVAALRSARSLGDVLVVGLNSDRSVRELKGEPRPLIKATDRACLLSALEMVDRVVIFDGLRCDQELLRLSPEVWSKSGDYQPDSLDPREREAVTATGGKIVITPLVPGLSTSSLLARIKATN
ncbi:MAG: adenylyltransferase/cytidyltransferase family protein [Planctomycetota bacterium]|jgi:rfaE bifunctional protein nucleotidyltransferase chain/domain|nr:adenylyltransferase/cytidyltransferase family protein [Planctomycetota bacterium]